MELDIRCLKIFARLHEPGREACGHRHRSGPEHQVLQPDLRLTHEACDLVIQRRFVAFIDKARLQMILEILANARQILNHFDPVRPQLLGFPKPRQHHDLRCVDRPTGQDHFATDFDLGLTPRAIHIEDAGALFSVQDDLRDLCMRDNLQVFAVLDRVEECDRRAAPPTVASGQLEEADAFLFRPVVVRVEWITGGLRRCDPGVRDRALDPHVANGQGALVAVIFVRPAFVPFGSFEERQDIVPAPAGIPHLTPAVVILRLPADVQKPVQRRRSAQHLATRPFDRPPVQPGVRLSLVAPVNIRIMDRFKVADGDVDPWVDIAPTSFKKDDLGLRIGTQPIGDYAPRRPRSDNHIISFHASFSLRFEKNSMQINDTILGFFETKRLKNSHIRED